MERVKFRFHTNIGELPDRILRGYLSKTDRPYYQGGQNIYFDGCDGLGASAVLAGIAESARSSRFEFDTVIHLDCSMWESRRAMQRRIAEELKLDRSAMALFDKQDEEDDFSGVRNSSRAETDDVGKLIYNILKDRRVLVIFHNGSDEEIDLARSGIPVFDSRTIVLWTFRGRFRLDPTIKDKVKNAHCFFHAGPAHGYQTSDLSKLVHEEAALVSHEINPTIIMDCWFYLSFLHYNHGNFIGYDQNAHASNYWVCDGIIPGDSALEIGNRLHEAMRLEYHPTKQNHTKWFDQFSDLKAKNSRWISVTCKSVEVQNIQTIPKEATSYFLTLEKSDNLTALPKHLFEQANKLRVLRLSCCTFSFASPPFICCSNLRFLLIENCSDEGVKLISEGDEKKETKWAFLQSLWVLDIRGTNWDWILSPSKMMLMIQLRELNLKAAGTSRCVKHMTMLELTWLCNLRRLRVIGSSTFLTALVQDSFMGLENLQLLNLSGNSAIEVLPNLSVPSLQLLDLSGNSAMEVLPNLSGASRLRVLILDGCAGLKHVEADVLPTSLELFSFDGFGPASGWKHTLEMPEEKVRPSARTSQESPIVSKISLEGCARLKDVFLRGLPNLEELNLSNTAIKELDLEAMQVPQLKRLLLLGCQNLCRVQWHDVGNPPLKLLCVDSRVKTTRALDDDCQGSCFSYKVQEDTPGQLAHIVVTDARFLRGFYNDDTGENILGHSNVKFYLHLSRTINHTQVEGTNKQEEISPREESSVAQAVGLSFPYADVLDKVVNRDGEDVSSMQACTQLVPSERHIEITEGGCNWESDQNRENMDDVKKYLLMGTAESLHVHDNSSITVANVGAQVYRRQFGNMRWCRVDRCPKLHSVFLLDEFPMIVSSFKSLETLWASHLLAVKCIWSRKVSFYEHTIEPVTAFQELRYIHLHSCPRLKYVLPWSFPTLCRLETIHITYCGELTQIFPKGEPYKGKHANRIEFPSLKHIHLHDLPMLQHICEIDMFAPALETIKLRGCWSLRRLPAIHSGRRGDKLPAMVDCEKDWWDKLEWGGLEASRLLFRPRHSRYYRKTTPRGSILR